MPYAKKKFDSVKDIGNDDSTYISVAGRLASLYYGLVMPDSALVYYVKASEGVKKRYGVTSSQYGILLVRVAIMYTDLGQYQEAGQAFKKAIAILKSVENTNKREYVTCLAEYASFYITTGNLNKAEELCISAREIALRKPVDIDSYASALEKLGRLYSKMGFYAKQEAVEMQIFEIYKDRYEENHYKYAQALVVLAGVYQRKHNLEKADSMYKKALEIQQQVLGKKAATNIALLRRIGIVNTEMGKYSIAEKYLKEALEIVNENGGEASPLYTICSNNLARLYASSGREELALLFFQKSIAIYNKLGLTLHPAHLNLLYDMANLLSAKNPAGAAIYLKEAMVTENKLLLQKLDFLSETELLTYLKEIKDATDNPYRFLLSHKSPEITGDAYNSRLLISGIGLQNTGWLYQNMAHSRDNKLAVLWKNYQEQKSFYTNLLLTPVAQRNTNTDSVAALLNQQEKDILRRSADYRDMKAQLAITWQDVQKHLQPGETAIEFVRFNGQSYTYTEAKVADIIYYAALLLRPGDTAPRFVMLCKEQQLISALKKFPYKGAGIISRGQKAIGSTQSATNILYQLIWQRLEPYLTKTRTIYFSPAGMLHRVAFAAIPYNKNNLLCDKYDLVQLTSTRQVALQGAWAAPPVSIAMFGGINYNSQFHDTVVPVSPYPYVYSQNRGADIDSFCFLPNTLTEINAIKTDVEAAHKQLIVFTGVHATETAFRSLGGNKSPQIIHFATHGFTLSDTAQSGNAGAPFKVSDNPLLRCGLVMAGGNKGWRGKAGLNEDDGILTGLEISSVQLPNTQLAVLSACETGLGKIEGNEGVFGLQRAFKLAGVNYIMASLWQVPDRETAEFMETFYLNWLDGKTIREAFFGTQHIMRKKYAPYFWAGFTLVQ
ncbi:MAG: CHAT domain-containing protein [Agriterribacter sp.]